VRRLKQPYSLSWHLVVLVLAAMIPFFIFSALMVDRLVNLERQVSERRLRREAQKLMISVDQEFTIAIRTLQALAASSNIERRDLQSFHEEMRRVQKTQPSWETILVRSPNGELLASAVLEYDKELMSEADYDSIEKVVQTGKPVIGRLIKSPIEGSAGNKYSFPVRIPVFDKDQIIYVLSAIISVDRLQLIVSDSIEEEWTRTIVDGEGTVAARSRSPEAFVGKKGTPSFIRTIHESFGGLVRETTLEGKEVYMAYDRSPASGWAVCIPVPVDALEAQARRSMQIVVATGMALVLSFGGLALFYSRRLANRIKSATTGAMALAEGQVPLVEKSMVKEVEQLRVSLLTVSKLLQQREQERSEHLTQAVIAKAEAEQANRAKSEFLANMSHELRTPLGVVLGFSDLMAHVDITAEERSENLEIIQRNGKHLLRLIDDILDLSKVEARRLTVEHLDFSLSDLISGVMADISPRAINKGIDLTVSTPGPLPETVNTDPIRLRQIIYNILGNAIKFTEKGEVNMQVEADETHLILTVRDSGIGLSEAQQKTLFRPFTQADSSHTRKYGGTGLGLALCKRLAELLGGDITLLESHPGRGSIFQIRVKVKG